MTESCSNYAIRGVEDFIRRVSSMDNSGMESFYRGHSTEVPHLEPLVARGYLRNEHSMYREMIVSNPDEFYPDKSTLERLARMQGHSLPTRLLDLSSNPLMALFFACRSDPQRVGEVIILRVASQLVKYFDSDTASCIANLARIDWNGKYELAQSLADETLPSSASRRQLLRFIREEKPYFEDRIVPTDLARILCVQSKLSNKRILFQAGAFLLFGLDTRLDMAGASGIRFERVPIGASDKPTIMKQLDTLNINERTVFPSIESSAKYIAAKYFSGEDGPTVSDTPLHGEFV